MADLRLLANMNISPEDEILPSCFRTLKKRKAHVFTGILVVYF
jgi:hypothetical protein